MRSMASGSASSRGIAAIVGVGPSLGLSIARKFAHEGYTVAILARDLGRLSRFAEEIAREEKAQVFAIRIDCSDSRSVREAFEGVLSLGFVEVLVYNAYYQPLQNNTATALWNNNPTSFHDLRLDSFQKSLAVSSIGAFHCAQQVLPGMVERGKGTILFTGCSASLNGIAGYSELCEYRLREIRIESTIAMPGEGISTSRSARSPCYHRWCCGPTQRANDVVSAKSSRFRFSIWGTKQQ
ncbi:hypothetical protein PIB30_044100 [Stylosanthes scabra]|uniref:Uncharacterized protein n=1 Tax=Stylosanthes scabra TaxID=79078 RepID=A0ABU6ZEI5_9FABA|nr:hypothetical protein [Stylosanthes scabra]